MDGTPDRMSGPVGIPPHRGTYSVPASGAGASSPAPLRAPRERTAGPPDRPRTAIQLTVGLLAAGSWLLLAPFALGYSSPVPTTSDLVAGSVLVVVALAGLIAPADMRWLGLVSVALGAWVVAAPFVLFYTARSPSAVPAVWNDLVVGAVVVVLGGLAWLLQRRA